MKWRHLKKLFFGLRAAAMFGVVIAFVACSSDDGANPQQKNFPQLLQATAGDGSIALTWVKVKGAEGYTVYWMSEKNETSLNKYNGQAITASDSNFIHTGLNNGANYRYVVTATLNNIESRESNLAQSRPQRTPPAKPKSVLVKPENDRITLRWNGVNRAERYDLVWSIDNTFTNQSRIQDINSPYVHTGLDNGQLVYYQLLAVNGGGETASEPFSATPNPRLPSAPTDLSITAQDGTIKLAWSDVSDAGNYELFWGMSPGVGTQDNKISGITSPYIHAPLINRQTYYYTLRSRNAAGSSALSGEMQATTNTSGSEVLPLVGTPPSVPMNLLLAGSDGQLDITWELQQNASGYNLYWATESSAGIPPTINTSSNKIANISPPYTHLGLSNGERYYYRVSAINDGGESALTPMVNQIPEIVQPGVPGNVSVIGGEGFIGIRWNRVRDAQSYSLYYSPEGGATIVVPNLTEPLYQVSGLNNGTVYRLQVTSTHVQSGESPRSTVLTVTPQVDPLVAPIGVRAIPGDAEVALQFDISGYADLASDKAVQAFRIYVDTSPAVQISDNFVNIDVTNIAGDTVSYRHANLVNGRRYYYTVTAVNAGGESPLSREVWAQTQLTAPGAPQNFQLTEADSEVTLLWQAPPGTPPINYNLYWSQILSNGNRSQPVVVPNVNNEISPGSYQYILTGLINNSEYFVQIKAFNESGEGLGSTELGAVPHVIAPTGVPGSLNAQAESLQVTLSWDWDDATQGVAPPHYRLYWSTQVDMKLQNSSWVDAVQSGYIHQELSNGQRYYYRVAALNDAGTGPVSSLIQAVPLPRAPGQVTGLQTQGSDQAVILSWDDVPGADNYFVYSTTNPLLPLDSWNQLSGMTSGDLHQPVTNGATYYYVVTATNLGGESDSSQVVNATPQAPAPTAPQGLAATADNTRVILDWSTEIGLNYTIYWVNNSVDDPFTQGQVINDVRPAYSHTGLTNTNVYRYVVTANNTYGESAPSQVVSAIPLALQTGAPRNLTAVAGNEMVSLSWQSAPAANVNTQYSLYVSNRTGTGTSGTSITNVTSPYMHSGLSNSTQYYYVVTAIDDVESATSNEANAQPLPPAPAVPSGLVAIAGDSLIDLSWNASQNANSYTLVWDTIGNFSTSTLIPLGAVTRYQHTGRRNGTTYYYRLQANNGPASSADSYSVSATPLEPVLNAPPQLQIVSPAGDITVKIGQSVNFQLDATDVEDDAVGQSLSYQWDFGAGSGIEPSQLQDPGIRRFLNPGIYTVTATVTDSKNASSNTSQIITVSSNQPPDSTISTPAQDVLINVGDSVNFSGQGQDLDNNLPLTYNWRFGDSSGISNSKQSAPGTITFTIPGVHIVQFTVTDSLGLSDPSPAVIIVRVNTPPVVQIDSPTEGSTILARASITLLATGSDIEDDAAGLPLNYLWSFSGPVTIADINQQNPAPVALNSAGQYSITLTVSDSQGAQAQQSRNITVMSNDQPPVIQSPVPVGGLHAISMDEDNNPSAYAAFVLRANDPEGQNIVWSIAPAPSPQPLLGSASFSNIAVSGVSASLEYTVDPDANGVDSFDVRVTDPQGGFSDFRVEITITGQNDLPIFQSNQLTINEGQKWILNSDIAQPNLVSNDVDNIPAELTYRVITASLGQFELVSVPGTPISSFNHQQVLDQLVSFAHFNGSPAPSYSLTVEDLSGTPSSVIAASISFTAAPPDTLPNPLGFINQTDIALNADVTSNEITVAGINRTVPISVVGGLYSIDGAGFTRAPSTISVGQRIRIQHTSSTSFFRNTTTTLTIGTGNGSFTSRTVVNQAPIMTVPSPITLNENSAATAYIPQAIDPEGQVVNYSLSGVDATVFELDAATGELQFIVPADFEAPADIDIDNIYQLIVTATDTQGATDQVNVTINILNEVRHLAVEVLFPTPGSDVGRGYNTTTTVLSKFVDLEQGAAVVISATANNVALSETSVGSGIWMAQVNALAGVNLLDISANIQGEAAALSRQTVFNNNGAMRDPKGIAVDSATNTAYVIDGGHEALLKVNLTTGLREIISDTQIGTGSDTSVFWPQKIRLNANKTRIYVSDSWGSGTVWDIDLATGNRVTLGNVGGGQGLALYPPGNQIFIASANRNTIFGVDLSTNLTTTISSNTIGVGVNFGWLYDIESNPSNTQYIVASQRTVDSLILMDPTTGDRTSLASDIVGAGSAISEPYAITWHPTNNSIWVASNGIVEVDLDTLNRTRLLSTNYRVYEAALDVTNNRLLLADSENSAIRTMSLADNSESTFSDGAIGAGPGFGYNRSAVYDAVADVVYTSHLRAINRINLRNGNRTLVSSNQSLREAYDLVIDSQNQALYGISGNSSSTTIFKFDLKTGVPTILASSTTGTGPTFTYTNFAIDFASQTAWVTNSTLVAVIEVDLSTGNRVVLSDSTAGAGDLFSRVNQVTKDTVANRLLVSEGNRIMAVEYITGNRSIVSDVTNTGPALVSAREMSFDSLGNRLFYLDNLPAGLAIVSVDIATGNRTLVSQVGVLGTGPMFNTPEAVSVDPAGGRLFMMESGDGTTALTSVAIPTGDRTIVSQKGGRIINF